MTASNDPDQIRAEIERTRSSLSYNVDNLAHEAKPSTIAKRKVGRVSGAASGWRERVMGSAAQGSPSVSDSAQSAQSAMSSVSESAQSAPAAVRSQARGNPLAAGVVAFGAGRGWWWRR